MAQEVFISRNSRYSDDDGKVWETGQYVWDTDTLSWVKMTQPMVEVGGDVIANFDEVESLLTDVKSLLAKTYWLDVKYDQASATVLYVGRARTHKASSSTGNLWWIMKYTFNASGKVTRVEGPLNDDWDDRASLVWA